MSFALHDAQRVLARTYGYESWSRLKAFVDGMNVHELTAAVKAANKSRARALLDARPELAGMDWARTMSNYAVLGRDLELVRFLMEAGPMRAREFIRTGMPRLLSRFPLTVSITRL